LVPRKDERGDDQRLRANLSLAIWSLLWGGTFVVAKNALDHASVFIFVAARLSVGLFRKLKIEN